jgi:hypothetical protein
MRRHEAEQGMGKERGHSPRRPCCPCGSTPQQACSSPRTCLRGKTRFLVSHRRLLRRPSRQATHGSACGCSPRCHRRGPTSCRARGDARASSARRHAGKGRSGTDRPVSERGSEARRRSVSAARRCWPGDSCRAARRFQRVRLSSHLALCAALGRSTLVCRRCSARLSSSRMPLFSPPPRTAPLH